MDKMNPTSPRAKKQLSNKAEVTAEEVLEAIDAPMPIQFLSQDIAAYMGEDFLGNVDQADLEAYCLRTIERDEPTGKLLAVLIQNFMKAYGNTKTSEEAMKAFDYLTHLVEQSEH